MGKKAFLPEGLSLHTRPTAGGGGGLGGAGHQKYWPSPTQGAVTGSGLKVPKPESLRVLALSPWVCVLGEV